MRRVNVSTGARQAIASKAQVGDSVGMRVRGQSAGRVLCMLAGALSVSVVVWAGAAQPLSDAREPWLWPSGDPVPVARAFDDLEHNWLPGHRGVDLDVLVGSPVYAPADGTVVVAGVIVDRPVVSVSHGSVRSTFEPVEATVTPGDEVRKGDVIGHVASGHSPGALHWGVKSGPRTYHDPLRFLVGPIVLKPWE